MKIRRGVKKLMLAIGIAGIVLLLLAFPFGPLLPWSPVKPGYAGVGYARAEVFHDRLAPLPEELGDVDGLLRDAEAFHHLTFKRKVRIILCKNWRDCERGMPWLNTHALGGVTLATGDAIYITPKLREKNFSIREFLRHELSHALISQNTTVLSSFRLNKVAWFNEGMAVSFGRQRDYLGREEFLARAKDVEMARYLDPARMEIGGPGWEARFAYPAQRYFVEYLKQKFGEDRFSGFLTRCIADPDNHARLFEEAFQQPLSEAIREYEQAVKSGQWLPKE